MPRRSAIKQEITLTRLLKSLVTTYEEIAVMRIQKTRESVLHTRSFHQGLTHLLNNVKASHSRKVTKILKKNQKKATQKRGVVFISTNKRLSGSITTEVFQEFLHFIDTNPHDVIVTGLVGKDLVSQTRPDKDAVYFDLPEELTPRELKPLTDHLKQYEELIVFHGQFLNLVDQAPVTVDFSSTAADSDVKAFKAEHEEGQFFLFEPSLKEVVNFFETEIFAMLFRQMTHEAYLAQLGSRITAMEKASRKIDKRLHSLSIQHRQLVRRENNDKQRERLAGMSLWS